VQDPQRLIQTKPRALSRLVPISTQTGTDGTQVAILYEGHLLTRELPMLTAIAVITMAVLGVALLKVRRQRKVRETVGSH